LARGLREDKCKAKGNPLLASFTFLVMQLIALVLACLASTDGRRIKQGTEHMQDGSHEEGAVSLEELGANAQSGPPNLVKALPVLLASFSHPAEAFSIHDGMSVNVPGERLAARDPNGLRTAAHSAVRMQGVFEKDEVDKRMPWEKEEFKEHLMQRSLIGSMANPRSEVMSFQDKLVQQSGLKESDAKHVLTPGDSFGQLHFLPLAPAGQFLKSASTFDNDLRKWTGNVTSFNSGGYMGIGANTLSSLDLTATKGVELKLQPDSNQRRFKLMLRDDKEFKGVTWAASFTIGSQYAETRSAYELVHIPYSDFTATLFSKPMPDLKLDLTNIVGVQLVLGSFNYEGDPDPLFTEGPLELDVLNVGAY